MLRVMRKGARCAVVVAEGVFPDRIVPADLLLARLCEKAGFDVEKIVVANLRTATRNRSVKIGRARESIIVLRK